jgi:Rieske Fe-S protein
MLTLLLKAGGLVVAGVLGLPAAIAALSPVLRRRPYTRWAAVGRLDDFPAGQVKHANVALDRDDWAYRSLREQGVYVWRPHDRDEIVVYARNCTDLSCPVVHDPGSGWFFCPCHGGIFTTEGEPVHGPPRRPLYRYITRVENGVLEIDMRSLPVIT